MSTARIVLGSITIAALGLAACSAPGLHPASGREPVALDTRIVAEPVRSGEAAEQLLKDSRDSAASRSVEIQQTVEQTTRMLVSGKPLGVPQTTRQTSVTEIDTGRTLIRMTTRSQSGEELVVVRKGERIAMRIGSGSWTAPQGPYARIGDLLANPFACPMPKAGDERSPRWAIVGPEWLNGIDTTVIETVGDTANEYARLRIVEGMASVFTDAADRPTVEVLTYKSRLWIDAKDHRPLRVEQTSHQRMTMTGAEDTVIDISATTTTLYRRYDHVEIEPPEEARGVLDPG